MRASVYPSHHRSEWILAQRQPRLPVDPRNPYGFFLEQEIMADATLASSAVLLLTNKECPWRCLMCDLWKHTLPGSVPLGAIPEQIQHALAHLQSVPDQVKLYNSGSFFDPGAIPPADYPAIASQIDFARNVVVESHPRLIGARALEFRNLLSGSLEVAMGLETIHPGVFHKLNKGFTLQHFAQASTFLRQADIALRAFVLVQPPFTSASDAAEWAVRSAEFAFTCGAGAVSLIPTRPGNGALEQLIQNGEFTPPSLATLETAFERCLDLRAGRVFADTWELRQFASCPECFPAREKRLTEMNLSQTFQPRPRCPACGAR